MIWLTVSLLNLEKKEPPVPAPFPEESEGTGVVHNTIVGYTTDITKVVANARQHVVSVTGLTEDREVIASGVIYAVNGNDVWILSSSEVLREDAAYVVRFDNGITVDAELKGSDPLTDIAMFLTHPDFEVRAIELGTAASLSQGNMPWYSGRATSIPRAVRPALASSHCRACFTVTAKAKKRTGSRKRY